MEINNSIKISSLPDGATPIDDISGLKLEFIQTLKELYSAEFKNMIHAQIKYSSIKKGQPLSVSYMLTLHKDMFGEVWDWAGHIRNHELNIGVKAQNIYTELKKLIGDIKYWEDQAQDIVLTATIIHHRLVKIHPFLNGNGRWARQYMNIYLSSLNKGKVLFNENDLILTTTFRKNYINALRKADNHNIKPLEELHLKYYIKPGQ